MQYKSSYWLGANAPIFMAISHVSHKPHFCFKGCGRCGWMLLSLNAIGIVKIRRPSY